MPGPCSQVPSCSPAARPAARAGRPSPRPLRPRALVSFTRGHAHGAGTGERRAPAFRDCGSLGRNRKRRACRQRCACRRARPSGSVGGPPLPRLRESSRCLPAARSAATGKHTSLSLPLAQQSPSADARVAAAETNGRGVCGDRRRPRSQITKRKRGCNNGTMARAFRRRRRRRRGPPPSCRTDR